MKSLLKLLTVCLLLLSGMRLATPYKEELQQSRASKSENSLIPSDSSLVGIDANGNIRKPELGINSHLRGHGRLLIFVVHRDNTVHDIQYWNRAIDLLKRVYPKRSAAMQYWGICDDGNACNSYQSIAEFSILGYLDAYEMRVVAKADSNQEALLFDESMRLTARIPRTDDPSTESSFLLKEVK